MKTRDDVFDAMPMSPLIAVSEIPEDSFLSLGVVSWEMVGTGSVTPSLGKITVAGDGLR